MIFLAVLVLATAGSAAFLHRSGDRRAMARFGLGIALAVAGVTHFVNPTPFEQHLPGWAPAPALLVALSGAAEIALGIGLVASWPSQRLTGRLVAGFFVAVLPANLYVAVNDIDVDGQPGGAYPWIRLPFQLLFIAWALWSTGEAGNGGSTDRPPTRGLTPPLPWAAGPATDSSAQATTIVLCSLLQLRRHRDVPHFLLAALRLRSLFARSPGAIRLSLRAIPLHRTFWTLSQWESRDQLDAFVHHPRHLEVMRHFGPRMANSAFASWDQGPTIPDWRRAQDDLVATASRAH